MKHAFLSSVMGLTLLFVAATSYAKPVVLSSLKPLTLIAKEITGKCADVDTLLPATASHHDYPLKTSDYGRLKNADLVLWVGPELESFLQKPLANLAPAKIITAYNLKGINWPVENHDVAEQSDHHHEQDPHLWLDPRNATLVAQAVAEKLILVDSANKAQYQQNLQLFATKMKELDEKLKISLRPVMGIGFAVYHEGFSHFVNHYGLHQLDYVTFTPEQKPGARHLLQLRETLMKEGKCLFLEPYNDTQSARDLALELHLRIGELDALGVRGDPTYEQLLEQMANAFSACLANRRN